MSSLNHSQEGEPSGVIQQRDRELVSQVNSGDMTAGLKLIELHGTPALVDLEPDSIAQWRTSDARIDGTSIRHVYATLRVHWSQYLRDPDSETLGAILYDCHAVLKEGEIDNPFVLEVLTELELMRDGESDRTRELKDRIRSLAEARRAAATDPHTRATLGHLILRNLRIESEAETESSETLAREVAGEFQSSGDRLGQGHVLLGLARAELSRAGAPAEAQEAVRTLSEAAELFAQGGDFASQAAALTDLAAVANRGSFRSPANDAAEELLTEAKGAFIRAGLQKEAGVIDRVLSYASPPNSPMGVLVSVAVLGLLIWAFVKGSDILLFLAFLGGAILIHEAGHAIAAGLVGIPLRRFRVGIGTRLFGFNWGKTRIEFCMIPFMGYVMPATTTDSWQRHRRASKEAATNGDAAPPKPELDLTEKVKPYTQYVSRPRRLLFHLGGVTTNFLAAVLLIWAYGAFLVNHTDKPTHVPDPITAVKGVVTIGAKFYVDLPRILFGRNRNQDHDGDIDQDQDQEKGQDEGRNKDQDEDRDLDQDHPETRSWIREATGKAWWNVLLVFAITNCILLYFNLLPIPPLDGSRVLFTGIELILRRDLPHVVQSGIGCIGYILIVALIILNVCDVGREIFTTIF